MSVSVSVSEREQRDTEQFRRTFWAQTKAKTLATIRHNVAVAHHMLRPPASYGDVLLWPTVWWHGGKIRRYKWWKRFGKDLYKNNKKPKSPEEVRAKAVPKTSGNPQKKSEPKAVPKQKKVIAPEALVKLVEQRDHALELINYLGDDWSPSAMSRLGLEPSVVDSLES
jgi:hypothetical protein